MNKKRKWRNKKKTKKFSYNNKIKRKKYSYFNKLIYKIIFISFLSLIISFISLYNKDIISEDQIIKEIDKIEPNPDSLNWDNVKKDFEMLAKKYEYLLKYEKNIAEDSPIWTMWYQGIDKAPPIVLSCIQSIILNRGKHPVYIISKYNLHKYLKLPSYIIEKYKNGSFTTTHFSDIIRMGLLYKYGGYWLDCTYFITAPLTKLNFSFFTLKTKVYKWYINFLASCKHGFMATFGYIAFLYYLKKYNSFIDYFLLDYMVAIAYNNTPAFTKQINNLPYLNCSPFNILYKLHSIYTGENICLYNKLSYKGYSGLPYGNRMSNFKYIIDNYKFNFNNISNNNIILNI